MTTKLKDLIGHKIVAISDYVELRIKTDKGCYEFSNWTFPDGTLREVRVEEITDERFDRMNMENDDDD